MASSILSRFDAMVLRSPATILDFGTIRSISCMLCMPGTLVNWENVACKLGYENSVIFGDFANHSGCDPAKKMLLDFIHRKHGRVGELVQIFQELELFACLEEMEKALENYVNQDGSLPSESNDNDPLNSSPNKSSKQASESWYEPDSDGTDQSYPGSINTLQSSQSDHHISVTSAKTSEESSDSSELEISENGKVPWSLEALQGSCPSGVEPSSTVVIPQKSKSAPNTPLLHRDGTAYDTEQSSTEKASLNDESIPFIQRTNWPEAATYHRSISAPPKQSTSKGLKGLLFKRANSMDPDKSAVRNKKPTKANKFFKSLSFRKNKNKKVCEGQDSTEVTTAVEADGFYVEEKQTPMLNCSPVKVATSSRSDSTSSDESLPLGSPNSLDYESGYNSGGGSPSSDKTTHPLNKKCPDLKENWKKTIYIICANEDSTVFEKALQVYNQFNDEKGYQCHMDAIDYQEFRTNGNRYVLDKICEANFVFLCVSEKLKEIFEARRELEEEDKTLRFSSDLIMGDIAGKCCNKDGKFMTILLEEDSYQHIPLLMMNYCKYRWPKEVTRMENNIHNRPDYPRPPVSEMQKAPPQKVVTTTRVKSKGNDYK